MAADIRRAEQSDITELNRICALCFTHSLLWSGDFAASRAWWSQMIAGSFAEVWVLTRDPAPDQTQDQAQDQTCLGFIVLLTDEAAWIKERDKITMTRFEKAVRLVLNPQRIWQRYAYKSQKPALGTIPRIQLDLPPKDRVFVEHFAVSPEAQGQGLGHQLIQFSLERTRHHARRGVCYMVDRTNTPMLNLMKSHDFHAFRETPVQFSFARLVDQK